MLAGGTGIAPMYQVLQAILKNPNDRTQVGTLAVAMGWVNIQGLNLAGYCDCFWRYAAFGPKMYWCFSFQHLPE